MDSPLWTEKYAPELDDIRQDTAREFLMTAVDGRVNLFVYGPRGAGKTAAVNAFLEEKHDDIDNDVIRLNADDFFSMSVRELSDDERFARFITPDKRRNLSKAGLMNHVLREMAGYQPVASDHKTLVIENAEAMRDDFQHALRRVMERHSDTTQYVLVSRSFSALIDPIRSRCFPVPVTSPDLDTVVDIVTDIADSEGIAYDASAIEYLVGYAESTIRESILALQTVGERSDEGITVDAIREILDDPAVTRLVGDALDAAEDGDISSARDAIDELLITEGVDGTDALPVFVDQSRARYDNDTYTELVHTASDIDMEMRDGTTARVHLARYVTEVANQTR